MSYFEDEDRCRRIVNLIKAKRSEAASVPSFDPDCDIAQAVSALCKHAVVVRITPPDCATCGFEVAKVVTPGLPLYHFGKVGTPRRDLSRAGLPRSFSRIT